jgi:hypothetical protein
MHGRERVTVAQPKRGGRHARLARLRHSYHLRHHRIVIRGHKRRLGVAISTA